MGNERSLRRFSQFDDNVATALKSTSAATVIEKIDYLTWCNEQAGRNFFNGRYWVYNSFKDWQEKFFPYWTDRNIKKIFAKLEAMGVLLTGNFNKMPQDRTKWYSIDRDRLNAIVTENLKALGTKFTMPQVIGGEQSSQLIPYISNKYIDKEVISGDFRKSPLPRAYVRRYGEERLLPMMDFVDWYIDKGYPARVGHEHNGEDFRAKFSAKLLDFSDVITRDDSSAIDTAEKALFHVTLEDHNPTIYWATSPKVLGYWGEKTGHTFYDELLGTEYQYVEDAYGRGRD